MYEVEKGGRISLMNGYVTGGFVELVSHPLTCLLKLKKNLPAQHYKALSFDIWRNVQSAEPLYIVQNKPDLGSTQEWQSLTGQKKIIFVL